MEEEFEKSVEQMRKKSTPTSDEDALILYGLYARVMAGECTELQPWSYQVVARARWEAWYKNRKLSREEAMEKYIEKVKDLMK
jgi:diazepam-binding inhibitor (GABA receptor modulating acyl-CoA-binding protein)